MSISIHPLQKASADLLIALYSDQKLPMTSAMLTISNGYYPSIQKIIGTLEHYKNYALVSEFVSRNIDLISDAKDEIEKEKALKESKKSEEQQVDYEIDFSQIVGVGSNFEIINVFELLKKFSLKTIENKLSESLSELSLENLDIKIESINDIENSYNSSVSIKARIIQKR